MSTPTPKEPKIEKTREEIFDEMVSDCHDIYKKANTLLQKTATTCDKLEHEMRDLKRDSVSLLKTVTHKFAHQNHVLDVTRKVTSSCDDTLLNVLLAIRQNEYLQAYYPAQHGYPDMKITGSHPAKAAGKKS
jgi:ElaB/YqjD/DUF883 family membrane-anchored ribosome-binding protein